MIGEYCVHLATIELKLTRTTQIHMYHFIKCNFMENMYRFKFCVLTMSLGTKYKIFFQINIHNCQLHRLKRNIQTLSDHIWSNQNHDCRLNVLGKCSEKIKREAPESQWISRAKGSQNNGCYCCNFCCLLASFLYNVSRYRIKCN